VIGIQAALAAFLVTAAPGSVFAAAAPGAVFAAPSPGRATPAGMAAARAALVHRSDIGRGWSEESPPPAKVPALTCPGFEPNQGRATQTGAAASPTFQGGSNGPFVSETAHSYGTDTRQSTVWRAAVRPGLVRCAVASLRNGGAAGVRFTVTDKQMLALPQLPVPAAGYRVSGTASLAYQVVNVYLDMLVVGRGQTIAEIVVSSVEQPPRRPLDLHLLRTVARKLSSS
jgi:hypothetical protein